MQYTKFEDLPLIMQLAIKSAHPVTTRNNKARRCQMRKQRAFVAGFMCATERILSECASLWADGHTEERACFESLSAIANGKTAEEAK